MGAQAWVFSPCILLPVLLHGSSPCPLATCLEQHPLVKQVSPIPLNTQRGSSGMSLISDIEGSWQDSPHASLLHTGIDTGSEELTWGVLDGHFPAHAPPTHTHTPLLMCIEWWLFSTLFCSLFLFLFLDGVCRCSVNCYSFSSGFLDYCVSFPFSSVGYPGSDTGVGVTFPFADNTSVHTSCLTVSITGVYISASCCPFHSYSGPNYWAWACCCQVSRLLVDPTEWPLVV